VRLARLADKFNALAVVEFGRGLAFPYREGSAYTDAWFQFENKLLPIHVEQGWFYDTARENDFNAIFRAEFRGGGRPVTDSCEESCRHKAEN
jgi:hypothetical protein